MDAGSYFTSKQMGEIQNTDQKWKEFLRTYETPEKISDSMYRDAAMRAYLLGSHSEALVWFSNSAERGFPPEFREDREGEQFRQWKNYQDGIGAFKTGLTATLAGLRDRAKEVLIWSAVRLCDTDLIVGDQDGTAARAALYRTYSMLAIGQPWLKADSDLDLALNKIHDGTDWQHEWGLPIVLGAVILCRRGEITRSKAREYLQRLIKGAKRDGSDKQKACFHALYLQSAFPDVFDPILPPLARHGIPKPGRQGSGDGLIQA